MIISRTIALNGPPSSGAILGAVGSKELIDHLNAPSQAHFNMMFGQQDHFSTYYQTFMDQVITPIVDSSAAIEKALAAVTKYDQYIRIDTEEQLESIPDQMKMPIAWDIKLRPYIEEGTINAFGLTINDLPEDDVFGRLIDNGKADMWDEEQEWVSVTHKMHDPELTFEELDMIEDTREYMHYLLNTTNLDPTDYPSERGKLK